MRLTDSPSPRIACMMMVGPGEAGRYLPKVLAHAQGWADEMLIYGDAPDPATRDILMPYQPMIGHVNLHQTSEAAVRNELFKLADRHMNPGDLCMVLDADEMIRGKPDQIRQTILSVDPLDRAWNFHFLHLWTPAGDQHRVDGMWQPAVGTRMYRHQPGYRVESYGGWVCPPIPRHLTQVPCKQIAQILHWGYANPADRPGKHERYTKLEGHHPAHIDSILTEPVLEPLP